MSSTDSCTMHGTQNKGMWAMVAPYAAPPMAAAAAIIPPFHFFIWKSRLQLEGPGVSRSFANLNAVSKQGIVGIMKNTLQSYGSSCKSGVKAAPTIGFIVGSQIIVQEKVEALVAKHWKGENRSFISMLTGSFTVAAISVPGLAVFNGQTMGRSVGESLRGLTLKQGGAVMAREMSFLLSIRISTPVTEYMMARFGNDESSSAKKAFIKYSSLFMTGAIGSMVGHAPDTALTLWQKDKQIKNLSQLMRGIHVKAIGVGSFTVLFKIMEGKLNSK